MIYYAFFLWSDCMASLRLEKVNELLKEELGKMLLTEVSLKTGVFATIAKVRATPSLKEARVSVSVFPEQEAEYVMKSLEYELYKIQGLLNRRLHMRPLPRIFLEHDVTERNAQAVEETLSVLKKEQDDMPSV